MSAIHDIKPHRFAVPIPANYLRVEGLQDSIDIGALSDEQIKSMSQRVALAFVENAERRRRSLLGKDLLQ